MAFKKDSDGNKWRVFAFDLTNNQPVLGDEANITANISIDYAAAVPTFDTNPATIPGEDDGYYFFDLDRATETQGDRADLFPESSTANVQVIPIPAIHFFVADPNRTTATYEELIESILCVDYVAADFVAFEQAALTLLDWAIENCNPLLGEEPLYSTIRAWLVAHYYAVAHPGRRSRTINGVSTSYVMPVAGEGLRATPYGRAALTLDPFGCLERVSLPRRPVGMHWGGTHGPRGTTRRVY